MRLAFTRTPLYFVRHLSGEIQAEYQDKIKGGDEEMELDTEYIMKLVREIVPFNMEHNAECESCDLLMQVERLDTLEQYVDELVHERVCLYLVRLVTSNICRNIDYFFYSRNSFLQPKQFFTPKEVKKR